MWRSFYMLCAKCFRTVLSHLFCFGFFCVYVYLFRWHRSISALIVSAMLKGKERTMSGKKRAPVWHLINFLVDLWPEREVICSAIFRFWNMHVSMRCIVDEYSTTLSLSFYRSCCPCLSLTPWFGFGSSLGPRLIYQYACNNTSHSTSVSFSSFRAFFPSIFRTSLFFLAAQ